MNRETYNRILASQKPISQYAARQRASFVNTDETREEDLKAFSSFVKLDCWVKGAVLSTEDGDTFTLYEDGIMIEETHDFHIRIYVFPRLETLNTSTPTVH